MRSTRFITRLQKKEKGQETRKLKGESNRIAIVPSSLTSGTETLPVPGTKRPGIPGQIL
jgi:hypothetical protein